MKARSALILLGATTLSGCDGDFQTPFVTPDFDKYVAKEIALNPSLCKSKKITSRSINAGHRFGRFKIIFGENSAINSGRLSPIVELAGSCTVEDDAGYRTSDIMFDLKKTVSRTDSDKPKTTAFGYVVSEYREVLRPDMKPIFSAAEKAKAANPAVK